MLTVGHEKGEFHFTSEDRAVSAHLLWCGPIHRSNSISVNPPLPAAHLQPGWRLDRVVCVSVHMHVDNYVCLCVFLSKLGSYYSLIPLKYF